MEIRNVNELIELNTQPKITLNDEKSGPLTCRSIGEMQQIQSGVEHLIAKAHKCEHVLLIVQAHDEILVWIEEFV